jgi:hypothetical protein
MIPKTAIEKAIEGGWHGFNYGEEGCWSGCRVPNIEKKRWRDIALDPSFWQSLGKALDWYPDAELIPMSWRSNAIRFYDLILTGGDTEAFWKELLSK